MEIEANLAHRIPAALSPRPVVEQESILCGISEIDVLAAFPRGSLVEVCGPPSSGRTTILHGILAQGTQAGEACALIEGSDAFDPVRAQQNHIQLCNLLWVRPDPRIETTCSRGRRLGVLDKALMAANFLLQEGGFGILALDLAGNDLKEVGQIPLATWFCLRRAVEGTRTLLLVLAEQANTGNNAARVLKVNCASLNVQGPSQQEPSCAHRHGESLFDAISSEVDTIRGQARKSVQSAQRTAGFTTHFSAFA